MTTNRNDAAFIKKHTGDVSGHAVHTYGLTKREMFAAMAMQAILGSRQQQDRVMDVYQHNAGKNIREVGISAHFAVEAADALIEALNAEAPQPTDKDA